MIRPHDPDLVDRLRAALGRDWGFTQRADGVVVGFGPGRLYLQCSEAEWSMYRLRTADDTTSGWFVGKGVALPACKAVAVAARVACGGMA